MMLSPSAAHLSALLENSVGPRPLGVALPAGFPSMGDCRAVLEHAIRSGGAQFIQLDVPTSRPYLETDDVAEAHAQATALWTSLTDVFALVRHLAPVAPVMVRSFAEPVLDYGIQAFAGDLARAGAAGALLMDMPEDEAPTWHRTAANHGLHTPRRMEPTARPARMLRITRHATGYIHIPATAAVPAGDEEADLLALTRNVIRTQAYCAPPLVCDLSTPDDAEAVASLVDGVLLAGPLVRALLDEPGPSGTDEAMRLVHESIHALRAACTAGVAPGPSTGETS
jgi:tryptophan synthase alpha chain